MQKVMYPKNDKQKAKYNFKITLDNFLANFQL